MQLKQRRRESLCEPDGHQISDTVVEKDLFAFSDTMEERWGRRDREAERMPSS